jgi:hypothetical protein
MPCRAAASAESRIQLAAARQRLMLFDMLVAPEGTVLINSHCDTPANP